MPSGAVAALAAIALTLHNGTTTAPPNSTSSAPHSPHYDSAAGLASCPYDGWVGLTYPTATIVAAALGVTTAVLAVYTMLRMHGIPTLSFDSEGRGMVSGAGISAVCSFVRAREVLPFTHNLFWVIFWALTSVTHAYSAVNIGVFRQHPNTSNGKWSRLVFRGLVGVSTVSLTLALNHHRQHRHQNTLEEDIAPLIRRQVRILNGATMLIYGLYLCAELLTAAVVGDGTTAVNDFFWIYVACVFLINLPVFFNCGWIAVHKGAVRPSNVARTLLILGVVLRLWFMWPADLWNGQMIPTSTLEASPCPLGGVLSAFDVVMLLAFGVYGGLFAFTVLEYRRNRLLHIDLLVDQLGAQVDDLGSNSSMGYGTLPSSAARSGGAPRPPSTGHLQQLEDVSISMQ